MSARFVSARPIDPVATVACTPWQVRTAHMTLSVLLDYPRADFPQVMDAARESLDTLPAPIRADIEAYLDWAQQVGTRAVEEAYVDTFDQQRRCTLYLSYYATGDTRQRGVAILGFRDLMRAIGFEQDRDELADYLPLVLELSGRSGDPIVLELLAAHHEGIEVMRAALHGLDSPWAHLLDALCRTLPPVDAETEAHYQRLVTQGPPSEMVGTGTALPFPTSGPAGADGGLR